MSMLGQASFFVTTPIRLRIGVLAARPLVRECRPDRQPGAWFTSRRPSWWEWPTTTPRSSWPTPRRATAPGWLDDPASFTDPAAVNGLADGLAAIRPVGYRSGERRGPDHGGAVRAGFVHLRSVAVSLTLAIRRSGGSQATTLDLAAVFGSDLAYQELVAAGETDCTNYETQFAAMQNLVDNRSAARLGGDRLRRLAVRIAARPGSAR